MTNPIHILLLLALIFGYVLSAILVGRLADRRGRSFGVYVLASLIIGWVVPLVALFVLPKRQHGDAPTETFGN